MIYYECDLITMGSGADHALALLGRRFYTIDRSSRG